MFVEPLADTKSHILRCRDYKAKRDHCSSRLTYLLEVGPNLDIGSNTSKLWGSSSLNWDLDVSLMAQSHLCKHQTEYKQTILNIGKAWIQNWALFQTVPTTINRFPISSVINLQKLNCFNEAYTSAQNIVLSKAIVGSQWEFDPQDAAENLEKLHYLLC